jgi:hypothetical protein
VIICHSGFSYDRLFAQGSFDSISSHFEQCFEVSVRKVAKSSCGWSWGDLKCDGDLEDEATKLNFEVDGKRALELFPGEVAQVNSC